MERPDAANIVEFGTLKVCVCPADAERLQMSRSNMKMDISPEGMPPGTREDYLRMLGVPEAVHLEAALRPGCTQIVVTTLNQVRLAYPASPQNNAKKSSHCADVDVKEAS